MKIIRAKDYNDMSRKAANIISAQVILKPDSVLGLATGSSPIGIYEQLIKWYNKGDVDFGGCTTFNLDEYRGLTPDRSEKSVRCTRRRISSRSITTRARRKLTRKIESSSCFRAQSKAKRTANAVLFFIHRRWITYSSMMVVKVRVSLSFGCNLRIPCLCSMAWSR